MRRRVSALAVLLIASGCATLPPNVGQDPRDPWERYNRNIFAFNDGFDKAITRPLAELYVKLPEGVRTCLSNAFFNLRGPSTAINNFFQSKPVEALSDVGRFAVNTTVGIVGCFDVATKMGLEQHREDFGQTFGVWGFESGPYLVMPIFGPSSVRDAIGIFGVEPFLDLNFYIDYPGIEYTILGLRVINERAELLPADRLIREAALDRYSFIRDGYLQRRRSLVYDGNPPRAADPDEDDGEADTKTPAGTNDASSPSSPTKPGGEAGDVTDKSTDAKPRDAGK